MNDDITMTVYDEDVTSDDMIGSSTIKLSSLCVNGGVRAKFTIYYKNKTSGEITLNAKFFGNQ